MNNETFWFLKLFNLPGLLFLVKHDFIRNREPWFSKIVLYEMRKKYLIFRELWFWLCLVLFSVVANNIALPWQDFVSLLRFLFAARKTRSGRMVKTYNKAVLGSNFQISYVGYGTSLWETNGDVPLDGVAFSRLGWLSRDRSLSRMGSHIFCFLGQDRSSYLRLANANANVYTIGEK